jgi:hypothetical protein
MPIDARFPLVVYFVDLEEGASIKDGLVRRIAELQQEAGPQCTSGISAWTGDIHNVERIHCDPAFDWLNTQVGHHALEYFTNYRPRLGKIDFYIQRSWPGGALRFFNEARPNEVCAGIGSGRPADTASTIFTNYGSADYAAVEGRLLIFPAKQSHDVEAHESDQPGSPFRTTWCGRRAKKRPPVCTSS